MHVLKIIAKGIKPALVASLLVASSLAAEALNVTIECDDKQVKKACKESSDALLLKDEANIAALRRRATSDKEKFVELAHYYGYYSAKVSYTLHNARDLTFSIDLGPKYRLKSCKVLPDNQTLTLKPGQYIDTQQIVDAEAALLWRLKKQGHAYCLITKKEVVADPKEHTLTVTFTVEPGPVVAFGPVQVVGSQSVRRETIDKYLQFKEGMPYSPETIDKTRELLEKTGLFSSVIISEEAEEQNTSLPVTINVQESKHHSVGAGVAYATSFGPGVKASWENKNLRGSGDKLTFRTELWQKYQTVLLSLTKPHFHGIDQDLILVAEYDKLENIAFRSRSYNASGMVQNRIQKNSETMAGVRLEWLEATNYEGSHSYHLLKMPLQLKWSNANNLLDPTKGETLNIKLTPSTNYLAPSFFYVIHNTALSGYHSLFANRLTLAARVVFANILGANRNTIPAPDRIYGGSENVLRGYRAYTVSPLHHKKTPMGGRSMLAASIEARFRTQGDFGYVLFYDVGNVYKKNIPELALRQFHSVGLGVRYTTPIGPLRLDVAVPLNRRHAIDPSFQIYFSIGQSF